MDDHSLILILARWDLIRQSRNFLSLDISTDSNLAEFPMYIRPVFVQILDNYLLADLNGYMDFVCIQTLASCLIVLIYYSISSIYYSISMLNSAYSAFSNSLTAMFWLLNNALLCLKLF